VGPFVPSPLSDVIHIAVGRDVESLLTKLELGVLAPPDNESLDGADRLCVKDVVSNGSDLPVQML
jgi:hypothetical protein